MLVPLRRPVRRDAHLRLATDQVRVAGKHLGLQRILDRQAQRDRAGLLKGTTAPLSADPLSGSSASGGEWQAFPSVRGETRTAPRRSR
jgi:hypothetical protein